MFSCEYFEIFKNTNYKEHLRTAASVINNLQIKVNKYREKNIRPWELFLAKVNEITDMNRNSKYKVTAAMCLKQNDNSLAYYTNEIMQTTQRPMPQGNFRNNSETLPELIDTTFLKKEFLMLKM